MNDRPIYRQKGRPKLNTITVVRPYRRRVVSQNVVFFALKYYMEDKEQKTGSFNPKMSV
jgi:hypothetical protein